MTYIKKHFVLKPLSVLLAVLLLVATMIPMMASVITAETNTTSSSNSVIINAAGGTNYSLFNSGCTTSSGYDADCNSTNPAPDTHNNSGYDLYGSISSLSRFRLGLSFTVNIDISEQSSLSIKAWDIDESVAACGHGYEYDYIYLVDETSDTSVRLDTHLSGQNNTWNTSVINISPDLFTKGHTYHFELQMTCTGSSSCGYYSVTVRTVDLIVNGSSSSTVIPQTGISSAELGASISSTGLISANLTASAYSQDSYTLEYKAVCSSDEGQYGGKEYSVTIPTSSSSFSTTFQLESGAPRGTYEITVFIKNSSGNVIATRTAAASYGYSAVSYNSNGGSQNLPIDGTTYSNGDTVTVKFDTVPSMYGYTFLGWSTDRNATEPTYTANGTTTFTIGSTDVTLYAIWSENAEPNEPDTPVNPDNPVSPSVNTWDGSIATGFGGGSGTESDPYLIYTASQLAYLAQSVNGGNTYSGCYFKLMSDINLNNLEWTPIGKGILTNDYEISTSYQFRGTFDGNYHKIFNLSISQNNTSYSGLFGDVQGTVKNLGVENAIVSVTISGSYRSKCGALIGRLTNGTVESCYVTNGSVTTFTTQNPSSSGVLIGNAQNATIRNCFAHGTATSNAHAAILLGSFYNNYTTAVINCYAVGSATNTGSQPGGSIVCASGIIGCVSSNSSSYVSNCFFAGSATSSSESGPIIAGSGCQINSCYYSITGTVNSYNGISTYADNFKSQSWITTNLGWDFDTIWEFDGVNEYPVLQGFGSSSSSEHTHTPGEIIVDIAPTCSSDGAGHIECSACGETLSTVDIASPGHIYAVTNTVEATCTEDGYIEYSCSADGCDSTKHQTLYATGHRFGNDNVCDVCDYTLITHTHEYTDTVTEPTCTEMGYTTHSCSCGYEYRDSYVDQCGHSWGDGVVTIEKTCTEDGAITYTCSECQATRTDVIPAGHTWDETVTEEATCTEDGSISRTCTGCGETETDIIPAGHTWDEGTVTTEPTCTEPGLKDVTCTACGETDTIEIPKLGHRFVNGTCTVCGAGIIDAINPDADHPMYGMYFEIDDIISNYGPAYVNEYGVYLDYNQGATIKKVGVFLTQDGTMWRRCIACVGDGITYATYVPYLAHDGEILYTGLNSPWINTFRLGENSQGIWCYSDYTTIGVNLADAQGNLLLSLYDIGEAGSQTRIFDDLDEMIAWLSDDDSDCIYHEPGDWIVDVPASTTSTGREHKECQVCGATTETRETPMIAEIKIQDVSTVPGGTVSIAIEITNNPGIGNASFTLTVDPSLRLPRLTDGTAFIPLEFTYTNEYNSGVYNFNWNGTTNATRDGNIILLTFDIPDAPVGTVYSIDLSYTDGDIVNADGEAVNIILTNGSITVTELDGDVNEDGIIDVADVVVLRRYLVGGYDVTINEEQADVNDDGEITIDDVNDLRNYIVNN